MNINDRIKILIKWLIGNRYANSQKELGSILGYKNESYFSQIIGGVVPLSKKTIKKICSLDERINEIWLLTGEGEMLNNKYLLKDNSAIVNGNGNSVVSGENNRLEVSKCQDNLEIALREIQYLKAIIKEKDERLDEKERLINVLMNK